MGGFLSISFGTRKKVDRVAYIRKVCSYLDTELPIKLHGYFNIDPALPPALYTKISNLGNFKLTKKQENIINEKGVYITIPMARLLMNRAGDITFHQGSVGLHKSEFVFGFILGRSDAYELFKNNLSNCKKIFTIFKKIIKDFDIDNASITMYDTGGVWTAIIYEKSKGFRFGDKDCPLAFIKLDISNTKV